MKILISIGSICQGGAERVVSIISKKFLDLGYDVELLLYYDRDIFYSVDSRVKVTIEERYISKGHGRQILKHLIWRRKYIKEQKPDVVISFLAPFNMLNIVSMFGLNIPLVVADRNDPKKVPENYFIRKGRDFLYEFTNGVVLQNNTNKVYFSKRIQRKSKVIYNPIDLKQYTASSLYVETKEKVIVSVARVVEQKNPLLLLRAFKTVSNKFPEYKLLYLGNGDMLDAVVHEAEKLGIRHKVDLPGAVLNVFERIKSAELFVLNSNYEGMPNALLEAMCLGLPVISTKVSGAVDVIKNGENGLLVDCNDENGLAEAITKMLSDQKLRLKCANNASKLANELNVDKIVDKWVAYIEGLKK